MSVSPASGGCSHLDPVVLLHNASSWQSSKKEVSRALDAHELIKVRVPSDDREERVEIYETLAEELGAAKVQLIGKLFVLYRPNPDKDKKEAPAEKAPAEKKERKTGAKARNQRKRLTEIIQAEKKGKAKSLPWASTVKKGKTPKGQVKAVGERTPSWKTASQEKASLNNFFNLNETAFE